MSLDEAIKIIEMNIISSKMIVDMLSEQYLADNNNSKLENALASARNSAIAMSNALASLHIAKVSVHITQEAYYTN